MFLGVDVVQFRHVIATLLAFGLSTAASVLAAHVAKSLGPVEYDELNQRFHKWAVVGTNGLMFLTLLVTAAVLASWWTVANLGVAAILYVIFSKVITVRPHSFGARLRSVLLIRLPIAYGLSSMLPSSYLRAVVIIVSMLVAIWAVTHLLKEQKKYGWPTR